MPNVFTLEAVFAKKGDALILHYGPRTDTKRVLIDGGPGGVWTKFLGPRIRELRRQWQPQDGSLDFELAMVSHVDDDHINGILDMFDDEIDRVDAQQGRSLWFERFWHNAFDDIVGNRDSALVAELGRRAARGDDDFVDPDTRAVVASVNQGRRLRDQLSRLGVPRNADADGGFLAFRGSSAPTLELSHGLRLTVLGPDADRVEAFRQAWDDYVAGLDEDDDEERAAEVAAYLDRSAFNLASLVVLATFDTATGPKRVLLTGDARGDHLLAALDRTDLCEADGTLPVDVLKVPHHGSDRNVAVDFFRRIPAKHYVISGDGAHGNPEPATFDMIAEAAKGFATVQDPAVLWVTVGRTPEATPTTKSHRKKLPPILRWLHDAPSHLKVKWLEPDDETGVTLWRHKVDLAERLVG